MGHHLQSRANTFFLGLGGLKAAMYGLLRWALLGWPQYGSAALDNSLGLQEVLPHLPPPPMCFRATAGPIHYVKKEDTMARGPRCVM